MKTITVRVQQDEVWYKCEFCDYKSQSTWSTSRHETQEHKCLHLETKMDLEINEGSALSGQLSNICTERQCEKNVESVYLDPDLEYDQKFLVEFFELLKRYQ